IPSLSTNLDAQIPIDLYSMNWIIHLCGVVIDNSLGLPSFHIFFRQKTISKGVHAGSSTYIISQPEIYSHLFLKNQGVERLEVRKLFRSILIEYIRIFSEHDICVDVSIINF
ncbi:uncharacterized protein DC041_0010381, partial [Schistosoma bovis]